MTLPVRKGEAATRLLRPQKHSCACVNPHHSSTCQRPSPACGRTCHAGVSLMRKATQMRRACYVVRWAVQELGLQAASARTAVPWSEPRPCVLLDCQHQCCPLTTAPSIRTGPYHTTVALTRTLYVIQDEYIGAGRRAASERDGGVSGSRGLWPGAGPPACPTRARAASCKVNVCQA